MNALEHCSSTSAAGPDGLSYKVYKGLNRDCMELLAHVFNDWFFTGHLPHVCQVGLQIALPKGPPGEFRPITLKNALVKIFERVLYGRLYEWFDDRLPDYQFGFRNGMGCREQLV